MLNFKNVTFIFSTFINGKNPQDKKNTVTKV